MTDEQIKTLVALFEAANFDDGDHYDYEETWNEQRAQLVAQFPELDYHIRRECYPVYYGPHPYREPSSIDLAKFSETLKAIYLPMVQEMFERESPLLKLLEKP